MYLLSITVGQAVIDTFVCYKKKTLSLSITQHFIYHQSILSQVNGESVEENANLVIRLLIRRPECLGPALRGEGEGLLKAIVDANKMSERIADRRKLRDLEQEGDVNVSTMTILSN